METEKTIKDLDNYLRANNLYSKKFEDSVYSELNRTINSDYWKGRIEKSLQIDFKKILNNENIEVTQKKSEFEIVDNESQGATIWNSFLILSDKAETMDITINFIVNHNNAFIYLGKSHTNSNEYFGTSERLKQLFNTLKGNEKVGHFFKTKFYNLTVKDSTKTKLNWLSKIFC